MRPHILGGLTTGYLFGAVGAWGWTIADMAIAVVLVAAILSLVYIAVRQFNLVIPTWVIQVLWVVLVALVIVCAIKFVASL
jgi:hypothetical protein